MSARIIVEIREGLSVTRIERTVSARFAADPAPFEDIQRTVVDAAEAASIAHGHFVEVS